MTVICRQNPDHRFEVTEADLAFYAKMDVPPPTLCPPCRMQRRMAFRNFRKLYERKCDLSGRETISMYMPGVAPNYTEPFTVYDLEAWWGDEWDPIQYGRPFDFTRSFFDQVRELTQTVPKFAVYNFTSENCHYSNLTFNSRNCYLIFGGVRSEDCYYGHIVWESRNCVGGLYLLQCELCYQCVDCTKCYNLKFSQDCEGCFDSSYLYDCRGCKNCFGCVGLRNKEFYIFNEPYTKVAYQEKMARFSHCNPTQVTKVREQFEGLKAKHPRMFAHMSATENCSGDYVYASKDCQEAFDVKNSEQVKFAYTIKDFKDSYDVNFQGAGSELCYEALTCTGYQIRFSMLSQGENSFLDYCTDCGNCKYCFGCVGLKGRSYCILNRQYTKDEYSALVPRIIAHMRSTQEWGEFFPASLSPFGYDETIAAEYFPLGRDQALRAGFGWRGDDANRSAFHGTPFPIPEDIAQVPDSIIKQVLTCHACHKPYRVIAQELRFYRQQSLPIPRECFQCRHLARMAQRNPRVLHDRNCMKCATPIRTTYAPGRKETVYCEKCYQEAVY